MAGALAGDQGSQSINSVQILDLIPLLNQLNLQDVNYLSLVSPEVFAERRCIKRDFYTAQNKAE